jgi:polyhydroxyalkanoate synthesis repressor PhaR
MTDTNGRASRGDAAGSRKGAADGPVIIKKYANRRLYNTASSSYVTLENLAEMVRQGGEFIVYDAKTNDDITRSVLAQIIFEEESRGQNLLPQQFLRQLIRLYGDSMQAFIPGYLEASLDGFAREQEKLRQEFSGGVGGAEAYKAFQNQVRQNLAMVDQAMRMFTPFAYVAPGAAAAQAAPPAESAPEAAPAGDVMAEMRAQLEAMQRQIADLAAKK